MQRAALDVAEKTPKCAWKRKGQCSGGLVALIAKIALPVLAA